MASKSVRLPASSALHDAADVGDHRAVAMMLRSGSNANARIARQDREEGVSALHVAAERGHLEVVRNLLDGGAGPNGGGCREFSAGDVESNMGDWCYWSKRVCKCDPSPLHEAALHGHVEIVRALLAAGARRNARADGAKCNPHRPELLDEVFHREVGGQAPLHFAACMGHTEVVQALVEAGANVDIPGGLRAETPLHVAARRARTAVIVALLHKRADINAGDFEERTALHKAASVPALKLLLAAGAQVNGRATYSKSPFILALTPLGMLCIRSTVYTTTESDAEIATAKVEALLSHGARASVPPIPRSEPFCSTTGRCFGDYSMLGDHGRTPPREDSPPARPPEPAGCSCSTSPPSFEWTPSSMDMSMDYSDESSAAPSDLSESPSWPRTPEYMYETADHCCHPSRSAEESLGQMSLLFYAAGNGIPGIVSALLGAGLDPNEVDESSYRTTPMYRATERGHAEVVRLLLAAGAHVNAPCTMGGWAPLHVACCCTWLGCVVELLRGGADVNAGIAVFGIGVKTPIELVGMREHGGRDQPRGAGDFSRQDGDNEKEEEVHNDNKGGRKTGADTCDAIRRVLRREDRWRRRGGVITLKALLNKNIGNAPTATAITAAQSSALSMKTTSIVIGRKAIIDDTGGEEKTVEIHLGDSTDYSDANHNHSNISVRSAGVHAGKKASSNGTPSRFAGREIHHLGDSKAKNGLAGSEAKTGVTSAAVAEGCADKDDVRPTAVVVHADRRYNTHDDDSSIGGRVRPRTGGEVGVSREKRGPDVYGDALDGGPGAAAKHEEDRFVGVLAGLMGLAVGKEVVFYQIVMFL